MITRERVAELFEYRDGGLYWKVCSAQRIKIGDRAGSSHDCMCKRVKVDGKNYLEHRLIYLMHNGELPEFLDHIDGDRTNNRIENLRPCTMAENQHNTGLPRTNTSGVKGVSWYGQSGKWMAQLRINGATIYLGLFKEIDEAKETVMKARERYHGEFARHV